MCELFPVLGIILSSTKKPFQIALKHYGVRYIHMPEIGGLRHPKQESVNTAWKNSGFRGYADYMQTQEFTDSLLKIVAVGKGKPFGVDVCGSATLALPP